MEKESNNPLKEAVETLERKEMANILFSRTKTLKVDVRTWDSLKNRKRENETFNDVIKELLMERTKAVGNENIKAIKYERKTDFFKLVAYYKNKDIGFEFEYNDVKGNKPDFTFDLKIKTVFFGKRAYNPSEFFGVDNPHKHFSFFFLFTYLKLITLILQKEFKITFMTRSVEDYQDIVKWRELYYDYSLSEESFKSDIEEPLRLYEEEKPSEEWKRRIQQSLSMKQSTDI